MIKIEATSIYHALYQALENIDVAQKNHRYRATLRTIGVRGMETLEFVGPYVTHYLNPRHRVLDWVVRKANPFFHLMEALWILSGRQDVALLRYFNSNIAQYSDNGVVFNGAYGHRLRTHFGRDQIKDAIKVLSDDVNSRQAVLSIWDARLDLGLKSKDVPCNDLIMLKVRDGRLNMTVCCRSNDLIWGAYGANVVQFSILQEYMAAMLLAGVGTYTQVSDSMHVYLDNPIFQPMMLLYEELLTEDAYEPNAEDRVIPHPLVHSAAVFDFELEILLSWVDSQIRCVDRSSQYLPPPRHRWENPFFPDVVIPMVEAWTLRKLGARGNEMLEPLNNCRASIDWIRAAERYLGFLEEK